jgi:hypothetical protein
MSIHATARWLCAIALSVTALACAHAPANPGPAEVDSHVIPGFEAFGCVIEGARESERLASERRARADALRLASDVDYVLLGQTTDTERQIFAERGIPCEHADDSNACTARLAELEAQAKSVHGTYAITIAAGEVSMHVGEALIGLVGAIDTPADAWLVLMVLEGEGVYECDGSWWSGYRQAGDGYDIARRMTTSTCHPHERVQLIHHIDRAATVTRLSRTVVTHERRRRRRRAHQLGVLRASSHEGRP